MSVTVESSPGRRSLLGCLIAASAVLLPSESLALDPILKVRTWGGGFGTIVSTVAGIHCSNLPAGPSDCDEAYSRGDLVTLTANAAAHLPFSSYFAGWDGECLAAGLPTCTVILDRNKTIEARFYPADPLLTVEHTGDGSGRVTSSPAGIHCGVSCWQQFPLDTLVTLTAVPDGGSRFGGWSGACSGLASTCTFRMDSMSLTARANFYRSTPTLIVTKIGTGSGTVTDDRGGILCGADCSEAYPMGSEVTLSAQADPGSTFRWIGPCKYPGQSTCVVEVDVFFELAFIQFFPRQWTLTVDVQGGGRVEGPGIRCPAPGPCSASYPSGTLLTFTATPDAGSSLYGWGGVWSCALTGGSSCTFTIDRDERLVAVFGPTTNPLAVSKAGGGSGTVRTVRSDGSPDGRIDCGADCTEAYRFDEQAILEAIPELGSSFTGWSGIDCPGTGRCAAPMQVPRSVTANFERQGATLQIAREGDGSGRITSTPPGIDCPSDCSETYPWGTTVVLQSMPDSGSSFNGWSGACSGAAETCVVTLSASSNVTASFRSIPPPERFTLSVFKGGDGAGTVASASGRIFCGPDCSDFYSAGETETLSAHPDGGFLFTGWSGACSGTGSCQVTMDSSKAVTANFSSPPTYTLSVSKTGPAGAAGLVTSSPGGIDCGSDCSSSYGSGTVVTLTAIRQIDITFAGWGGACSGFSSSCTVTMDMSKNVTAVFTYGPR